MSRAWLVAVMVSAVIVDGYLAIKFVASAGSQFDSGGSATQVAIGGYFAACVLGAGVVLWRLARGRPAGRLAVRVSLAGLGVPLIFVVLVVLAFGLFVRD